MSVFDFFRRKQRPRLVSGGSGDSFQTAVVIHADSSFIGVKVEYAYIADQCGEPQTDWKVQSQRLEHFDGRPFDVLTVALSGGETRSFYFDISSFFKR